MKWSESQQQHIQQLERLAGPPAVRFAEWAAETLWQKARLCAIDMGLNPAEAENVAALVCAGTMRELRTAVKMTAAVKYPGRG